MSSSPGSRTGRECAEYMDSVLSGEIVACDKIKKLCRMMRPRIDGGYKCWHYDADRALRPVNFIERYCCLPEGKPGRKIALEPFQLFVIEMLFGFVDDNGLRQFHECMWVVGRKNGKALSLDTELPTPNGWCAMADIHVGDTVFGQDGRESKVIAESPVFDKKMYRVTFEDGAVIKASADHMWTVQTKNSRREVEYRKTHKLKRRLSAAYDYDENGFFTTSTEDMYRDFARKRKDGKGTEYKYRVPMQNPVEYKTRDLPLDPYMLGLYLGDGTKGGGCITCSGSDLDAVMRIVVEHHFPAYASKPPSAKGDTWTLRPGKGVTWKKGSNSFINGLRAAGVLNRKFIPDEYMTSGIEQRWELLRGLMDTDGTVSKAGQCTFCQKDEALARQVKELLASLGIKASIKEKKVSMSGVPCGTAFHVSFFTDKEHSCFNLPRKKGRLKDMLSARMGAKSIVSIEEIPNEPSKCIAIDNESHLYLAGRDYTPTHNTSLSAALAIYMLMADGEGAPQCYSAATSKDQASLLYGSMLRMVAQSPALSKRLHKGIIPARNQDGLQYRRNGGYFTPLSSQTRNLDGLNVHFAAIDEMAAITNRDTYDLIKQATPSRDQPLIIEITTNGFERDNLFDDQYDYASRILDGKAVDDTFLPVIYELDSRAEWTDEAKWIKANPGLGPIKKVEALRGYVNKAKQDPSFLPTVMTKDFNIPENKASAWLRFEEAVNREEFDYREMGFRYCIIGYDASDTIDLTAAQALMMRPDDERMYEMSMYWIPEAQLEKHLKSGLRKNRDNVPYQRWIDDGLVRVVPGNTIDHRVVFEWMQQLRDEFDIYPFAMGYDPWHLQDDSWKDGVRQFVGKKRMEEVRFGPQTLSAPMKQIRADYEAKRIVDGNNPVNQWCRMNVGIITDTNDNIKPVKANGSTGRIDGWAAEICAYIALMRHREDYMASI